MADFLSPEWFDQAEKDIDKFFGGDKAVESDEAVEVVDPIQRFEGTNESDDLTGGSGRNSLNGWGGNDTLTGQGGDDWLWGGYGNDVLTGGGGADEFTLSPGRDIITDFNLHENDTIKFQYLPSYGQFIINESKSFTLITDPSGNETMILGATGSDVYKSIVGEYEGQSLAGRLVAENFEVLA